MVSSIRNRKYLFPKVVFIVLGFIFSVALNGNLIDEVRNSIKKIMPFKVEFNQQLVYESQIELEEKGNLIVKTTELIKWIYMDPEFKIFLLQGDEYKFYDKEFKQLTIGKITDKKKEWIWKLLFSKEITKKCIEIKEGKVLEVKNREEGIDIKIFLNEEKLPIKIVQKENIEYERIVYFSDYKKNIKLSKGEFELKIPKDTDIIKLN